MKRFFAYFLSALMLLSLLVGCGSASTADAANGMMFDESYSMPSADYGFDFDAKSEEDYFESETPRNDAAGGTALPADAKMVYRATIEVETQDYITSETALTELVKSCGGYFESRSLRNRSSGYRYGEFTVRVPAEEYEHFCAQVGSLYHVTYMSSSAENITEAYYDTDARLKTAEIKLERLQSLLAKADNMADIITIESAISETEYTIESLSGTLRHYDALVDYATVSLTLSETYKLSENESAPLTFPQRVARAFSNGLASAGEFFEEFIIALVSGWVFLLIAAGIVFATTRVLRRHKPKFGRKRGCPHPEDGDDGA